MSDLLVFLRRFVSRPGQVGSVIPSSRFLSSLMMKNVPWEQVGHIAELGPGTGVFTRAILTQMKKDARFFIVERDPQFQQMLHHRFPQVPICSEAVRLSEYMNELNIPSLDAIVSGLPFAVFPEKLRSDILDCVVESLEPDGVFVTFQYSLQLKNELESRFTTVDIKFTPFNIPPAFVYVCKKR
ncbi:class I SAM-dependent methyltransferase [Brevibacillus laterosporus]|uniref:class I SAM-dependent methyltransferase n=1 Tax=Brevibacillus laterosporus TaxID=1465 RepID=UPI003D22B027